MQLTLPIAALICFFPVALQAGGQALHLAQTIPLPGAEGRIDHLAADVSGERLFICALGNNSVEVVDLQKGERLHSISGLGAPQGVAFLPDRSRLYVANDKGGVCRIYDAKFFTLRGAIALGDDADNVRYDSSARRIYVGYGDGNLGLIDANTEKSIGSIKLAGHPEAFVFEKQGPRIFVNVPTARHVAVIDRVQRKVNATWKTAGALANFPLALDEADHRLFVGCREPARIVVFNTDSGTVVANIAIADDTDDIFYDAQRHRLYAICGGGTVEVIEQLDRDNYKTGAKIQTAAGARTGLFVPELSSLFVAVPHRGSQRAEVRRYSIQ